MKRLLIHILAIALVAIFLIPLGWAVSTALKTRQQVYATPPRWIPIGYRAADETGAMRIVTVVSRIDESAAEVRLLSGPQSGQAIAVDNASLRHRDGNWFAQLRAAEPVAVEIVRRFPNGVAQVRFPDSTQSVFLPTQVLHPFVHPQWSNFTAAWTSLPLPFHRFLLNTYTITVLNVIGQTLSCSLVAYGFARFRFRGRSALFMLLLSTMMLPAQVTMIPMYLIWSRLHVVDTFVPLTLPAFFATSAFSVFLLRQFFLGLPRELDEAAMIDGCGPLRIWWEILMPLCRPAVITVAVLTFFASWDDFVGPLIYLHRLENYTVSIALRLFQDQYGSDYSLIMAAALVHIVPVVALFFVAQRYFVKGIAMSGLKG
jgi:ABC-type glycerol-3-phosphate transport system permease component